MKSCTIVVRGKVQGVYYRQTAREQALKLGLSGFVMNRDDGSVYIEAEGEEAALQQMADWCRKGPVLAKVTEVEFAITDTHHRYHGFIIRR